MFIDTIQCNILKGQMCHGVKVFLNIGKALIYNIFHYLAERSNISYTSLTKNVNDDDTAL